MPPSTTHFAGRRRRDTWSSTASRSICSIKHEVFAINLRRHAWEKVSGILQRHGGLPDSYWWEFTVETYATTQVMAVRRQADSHRDVVSLAKPLEQIAPDPERITRDFSLGLWKRGDDLDGIDRQMAIRQWDEVYGHGSDSLDPTMPSSDLEELQSTYAEARRFVNKKVAHAEEAAQEGVSPGAMLPMQAIHEPIDVIGRAFSKYSSLFTAAGWASITAVIQHNWKVIFTEP